MTHKASAGLVYLRADGVVSRSNRSRDAEYKAIGREQADDDPVCFAGLNYRRCMRSCNRCSQVCLQVKIRPTHLALNEQRQLYTRWAQPILNRPTI